MSLIDLDVCSKAQASLMDDGGFWIWVKGFDITLLSKVDYLVLKMVLWVYLRLFLWLWERRVQFIGQGVEGWMARMQGLVKSYGGLGCPKGKHMDCASLEPIREWHMSQSDRMEGRARWIVKKGGSRDKGFINAHKFLCKSHKFLRVRVRMRLLTLLGLGKS